MSQHIAQNYFDMEIVYLTEYRNLGFEWLHSEYW